MLGDGQVPSTLADFRRLPDADGCNGPMAAVLSALTWASDACWVIAACDLPRIRRETIRWLLEQREPGTTAVYPRVNGYLEPLLAIYEPAARLHLEEASRKGRFSLQVLPKMADVVQNQPPSALDGCWSNANTPSDLAELASGQRKGFANLKPA